jgi:hypothetical protein
VRYTDIYHTFSHTGFCDANLSNRPAKSYCNLNPTVYLYLTNHLQQQNYIYNLIVWHQQWYAEKNNHHWPTTVFISIFPRKFINQKRSLKFEWGTTFLKGSRKPMEQILMLHLCMCGWRKGQFCRQMPMKCIYSGCHTILIPYCDRQFHCL